MNYFIILFFLLFSHFHCSKDILAELQIVLDHFEHDPECVFNQSVVDSRTIKLFPPCVTVFAIIVINEKTDLTPSQIKKYLKKMGALVGGIKVENSNFSNLAFLPDPKSYTLTIWCQNYGVYIKNNENLKAGFELPAIKITGNPNGQKNCKFEVENNAKLNAEMMCNGTYIIENTDLRVTGNMNNCGDQVELDESISKRDSVIIIIILFIAFFM